MPRFSVILLCLSGCSVTAFFGDNRYTCDAGKCVDGYVCHPETNLCVRPSTADALATATGDACDEEGAFVPCGPAVTDCSLGCRTCGNDSRWSACSVPVSCEGVRLGDDCGACENKCLGFPEVQRSKCDISTGTAVCKVLKCKPGFVDGNLQASDGCEVACVAAETACDGVDEDCNGVIDDLSDAATDAACATSNATAVNVQHYACELGKCLVLACTAGFDNPNGLTEDGCEGTCIPSNGAFETCDGADNDCDGKTDPDDTPGCTIWYRDQDGDDFGDPHATRCLCPGVTSLEFSADDGGDCLDSNDKCNVGSCADADGDGWCLPLDCNDDAPACTLSCSACEEVEEPEPTGLTVEASAPVGTTCKTSTITVTPTGGTPKQGLISCSVAAPSTIVTYNFDAALAPFDDGNDRVERVAASGCAGQSGQVARLNARGGSNGIDGVCGGFLGTSPGARAVLAAGKTAAPSQVGLNLQGWRQLTLSAVFNATMMNAMADSSVTCNGASSMALTMVPNGCSPVTTTTLPAAHNECPNLIVTMLGDNRGCDAGAAVTVDNVVLAGVPRVDAVIESMPGVYTTTVTSCIAGARIEDLRCTYDRETLDDLFADVDVQF